MSYTRLVAIAALSVACSADPRGPSVSKPATQASPAGALARAPDGPVLGSTAPEWRVTHWAHTEALTLAQLRGRVIVVRWWTDTCPYCRKSLPALALLDAQYGEDVVFVGLFHEKPQGSPRGWDATVAYAEDLGVEFALGWDDDWTSLHAWWLDRADGGATSVSFVVGRDGTITHVHPGPVYFPSDDPEDARANADFLALREAIDAARAAAPD